MLDCLFFPAQAIHLNLLRCRSEGALEKKRSGWTYIHIIKHGAQPIKTVPEGLVQGACASYCPGGQSSTYFEPSGLFNIYILNNCAGYINKKNSGARVSDKGSLRQNTKRGVTFHVCEKSPRAAFEVRSNKLQPVFNVTHMKHSYVVRSLLHQKLAIFVTHKYQVRGPNIIAYCYI